VGEREVGEREKEERRRAGDAITYHDATGRERERWEREVCEGEKEERRRAGDAITSRRRGASSCSRQFSIAHWLNACIHAWGDGARRARRQHECEEE